jgi:pimeloyl-ACP methyl ester carboxylesterase
VALFQLPGIPERLLRPQPDGSGRLHELLVSDGLDPDKATTYTRALSEPGALSAALNWYRALAFERPDRAPGTIRVPTRYVWGSEDRALGRTAAQLTARYVEGDYRFIPLEGATHWLPETQPDEVAAAVTELVGR